MILFKGFLAYNVHRRLSFVSDGKVEKVEIVLNDVGIWYLILKSRYKRQIQKKWNSESTMFIECTCISAPFYQDLYNDLFLNSKEWEANLNLDKAFLHLSSMTSI